MQLICNGYALDLYQNTDMQFVHDNPLFAFEKISCERTTSFKLPATKTNDAAFALARVPASYGAGMRHKFAAQLQYDGAVKNGYLYVSEFEKNEYKAVFVTGDLVRLQSVRDAGRIRDLLIFDATLPMTTVKRADDQSIVAFDNVEHLTEYQAIQSPSVSMKYLVDEIAAGMNINVNWQQTQNAEKIRLIASNSCSLSETKIHLTRIRSGQQQARAFTNNTFLGIVKNNASRVAGYWLATILNDGQWNYVEEPVRNQLDRADLYEWICPYDCSLAFPADLDNDFFLVSGNIGYATSTIYGTYWKKTTFLGEYWFNEQTGVVQGIPLRGRTVQIPANTPFTLVRKSEFALPDIYSTDPTPRTSPMGFNPELATDYDIEIKFSCDHEFTYDEPVPYNAIMPDLEYIDLLKMAAALTGTVLYYTDAGGIIFDKLQPLGEYGVGAWSVHNTRVMKVGKMERKFADYERSNIIRFEDDPLVLSWEKLTRVYGIENDMLKDEKELLKLQASEGGLSVLTFVDQSDQQQIRNLVVVRGDEARTVVGMLSQDTEYMLRCSLPEIEGLQMLCARSTRLEADMYMTLLEYEQATAKTVLHVLGNNYVWTAKNWQKNVAKFTLAKLV